MYLLKKISIYSQKKTENIFLFFYDGCKQLPALINLIKKKQNFRIFKKLRPHSFPGIAGNSYGVRVDLPKEKKYEAQCHQELPFQMRSMDGLVFWSPLTKISEKYGYLKVYEKSHKNGYFPIAEKKVKNKSIAYKLFLVNELAIKKKFKCVNVRVNSRDLVLLDYLTLHQSGKNLSTNPRVTLQYRLFNYNDNFGQKIKWSGSFSSGLSFSKIKKNLSYLKDYKNS